MAAGCSGSSDGAASSTTAPTTVGGTTTARAGSTAPVTVPEVPDLPPNVFALGVASGDPTSESVILWTRLAPKPTEGGGMGEVGTVPLKWELADDASFATIVASGVAKAEPTFAHSVHVDVQGLEPGTTYSYRFTAGEEVSPVGTTRTAPAAGAKVDALRFVFASCQNWTAGYWTAWAHAADEDPDLVVFLGDYIYEGGVGGDTSIRKHDSDEIVSLDDYRNRYGLYKGDPALQRVHQVAPWIVTWDDHEVENNYAGPNKQEATDGIDFDARRAAAYQAFYEHHPVRIDPPEGDALTLYRTVDWGGLARFHVLDGRQYRTDQPCDGDADVSPDCAGRTAPGGTMLGAAQEAWLGESFSSSKATWNVIANQTIFSPLPLAGVFFNMDQWDGYPASRTRLLKAMADAKLSNPVFITGDIHASGVGDVTDAGPTDPVVATEFVGTSISSSFPADLADLAGPIIGQLEHIKWFEALHRGYVVCDVTASDMQVRYRLVDTALEKTSDISTASAWKVTAGTPGAVRA